MKKHSKDFNDLNWYVRWFEPKHGKIPKATKKLRKLFRGKERTRNKQEMDKYCDK